MQCTDQCDAAPSPLAEACYCRACAALPSWGALMALCERFGLHDVPECVRFAPMHAKDSCGLGSSSGGGGGGGGGSIGGGDASSLGSSSSSSSDASPSPPTPPIAPVTEYGRGSVPSDVPCVTSFGELCCPAPPSRRSRTGPSSSLDSSPATAANGDGDDGDESDDGSPCGEAAGRGRCVGVDTWMAAQRLPSDADASCQWPVLMGAARCLCGERFWGDDCGGCAAGYAGDNCERRLETPQVRRPFRSCGTSPPVCPRAPLL